MAYDGDFDGAVGTSDLLGLLTEFAVFVTTTVKLGCQWKRSKTGR